MSGNSSAEKSEGGGLRAFAAALPAAALLAGCAVGPDYKGPPALEIGSGWARTAPAPTEAAQLSTWWRTLGDPTLNRLIEAALEQNLDVRQAEARIAEARAARDAANGGRAPTLDASGGVTRRRQSENGALPIGSIPGVERDQTIREVGFDASWELDLFGGVRRDIQAAQARVQAEQEEARGVRIRIAGEVARTYFELRGAQLELKAQKASVETLRATLDITRARVELGDLAPAELEAASAEYADADAALPSLEGRARGSALALGVLLGRLPESELPLAASEGPEATLMALPIGERADVLRRRPDVRAAERRLAARTAEVGGAVAEYFPKLSISASGGFEALDKYNLFSSSSNEWSVAPFISWRVFDGGRIRAEVRGARAREQQAALEYEAAVLEALEDAERALSDYRHAVETAARRKNARAAFQRSYGFASQRFDAGDIALADLLDSERLLRNAEAQNARAQSDAAVALVALYKALGGGWSAQAEAEAEAEAGEKSAALTMKP